MTKVSRTWNTRFKKYWLFHVGTANKASMTDIRSSIDTISDKRFQVVLSYRYLLFENKDEIGLIVNYSDSHIKRLINHALDKLEM